MLYIVNIRKIAITIICRLVSNDAFSANTPAPKLNTAIKPLFKNSLLVLVL